MLKRLFQLGAILALTAWCGLAWASETHRWTMDEASGSTTWTNLYADIDCTRIDSDVNNTATNAYQNRSLQLDSATTDYCTIPDTASMDGGKAISIRFRLQSDLGVNAYFFSHRYTSSPNPGVWMFHHSDDTLRCGYDDSAGTVYQPVGKSSFTDTTSWHRLAMWVDGDLNCKYDTDTTVVDTGTADTTFTDSSQQWTIGVNRNLTNPVDTLFDNFQLYDSNPTFADDTDPGWADGGGTSDLSISSGSGRDRAYEITGLSTSTQYYVVVNGADEDYNHTNFSASDSITFTTGGAETTKTVYWEGIDDTDSDTYRVFWKAVGSQPSYLTDYAPANSGNVSTEGFYLAPPWDIVKEDWDSLGSWTDGDTGSSISSISPAGQLSLVSDGGNAHRYQTFSALDGQTQYTIEERVKQDVWGEYNFRTWDGTTRLWAEIGRIDLAVLDSAAARVYKDYLLPQGEWVTQRWVVDNGSPDSVDLWRKNSAGTWARIAHWSSLNVIATQAGRVDTFMQEDGTAHVDYTYIGSGLIPPDSGTYPILASAFPWVLIPSDTTMYLTGEDFGASQGAQKVWLCNSDDRATATCREQTVTSWADTSIDITINRGNLSNGTYYIFVEGTDGDSVGQRAILALEIFGTGFEVSEGYSLGNMYQQKGWVQSWDHLDTGDGEETDCTDTVKVAATGVMTGANAAEMVQGDLQCFTNSYQFINDLRQGRVDFDSYVTAGAGTNPRHTCFRLEGTAGFAIILCAENNNNECTATNNKFGYATKLYSTGDYLCRVDDLNDNTLYPVTIIWDADYEHFHLWVDGIDATPDGGFLEFEIQGTTEINTINILTGHPDTPFTMLIDELYVYGIIPTTNIPPNSPGPGAREASEFGGRASSGENISTYHGSFPTSELVGIHLEATYPLDGWDLIEDFAGCSVTAGCTAMPSGWTGSGTPYLCPPGRLGGSTCSPHGSSGAIATILLDNSEAEYAYNTSVTVDGEITVDFDLIGYITPDQSSDSFAGVHIDSGSRVLKVGQYDKSGVPYIGCHDKDNTTWSEATSADNENSYRVVGHGLTGASPTVDVFEGFVPKLSGAVCDNATDASADELRVTKTLASAEFLIKHVAYENAALDGFRSWGFYSSPTLFMEGRGLSQIDYDTTQTTATYLVDKIQLVHVIPFDDLDTFSYRETLAGRDWTVDAGVSLQTADREIGLNWMEVVDSNSVADTAYKTLLLSGEGKATEELMFSYDTAAATATYQVDIDSGTARAQVRLNNGKIEVYDSDTTTWVECGANAAPAAETYAYLRILLDDTIPSSAVVTIWDHDDTQASPTCSGMNATETSANADRVTYSALSSSGTATWRIDWRQGYDGDVVISTVDADVITNTTTTLNNASFDNGIGGVTDTDYQIRFWMNGDGDNTPLLDDLTITNIVDSTATERFHFFGSGVNGGINDGTRPPL